MSTLAVSLLKQRDTQRSPHGRASPSSRVRVEGGPINSSLQQMISRQQQPVVTATRLTILQRTQQNRVLQVPPICSPVIRSLHLLPINRLWSLFLATTTNLLSKHVHYSITSCRTNPLRSDSDKGIATCKPSSDPSS